MKLPHIHRWSKHHPLRNDPNYLVQYCKGKDCKKARYRPAWLAL